MPYSSKNAVCQQIYDNKGSVTAVNRAICHFWNLSDYWRLHPWSERVTTHANVADAISCDDIQGGLSKGWHLIEPNFEPVFNELRKIGEQNARHFPRKVPERRASDCPDYP